MNSSMHLRPQLCSKLQSCHSIQAALNCITEALTECGIDSPHLEARLLVQHCTGLSHERLLSSLQDAPDRQALLQMCSLTERRLAGAPIQYVLGEAWFYGRRFKVDSRVLIPRPETELLVETAVSLSAEMPRRDGDLFLLDVGTGSGVLAVTLAEEIRDSMVVACDISAEALQVARLNQRQSQASARVSLIRCDLAAPLAPAFGCVVANLPYVLRAEIRSLSREIRNHEPVTALDGGQDGLEVIGRLVEEAPQLLLPGAWLLLEIGYGQAERVLALLAGNAGWEDTTTHIDLAAIPRMVRTRWNGRNTNRPSA